MIGDFDAIIAGDDPITANVLERATRLKIVSKWGIGTDGIDLAAAKRLGIAVVNTPAVFGDEVADVAMGYVILLARQLHRIDSGVRAGRCAVSRRSAQRFARLAGQGERATAR